MRGGTIVVVLAGNVCLLPGTGAIGADCECPCQCGREAGRCGIPRGYEAANAGDLQKARRSFVEVVRLEPKIPEGHAALGSVLLNLGQPAEAASELKRGLALKPGDPDMEMNLAVADVRTGKSSGGASAVPAIIGAERSLASRGRDRICAGIDRGRPAACGARASYARQ